MKQYEKEIEKYQRDIDQLQKEHEKNIDQLQKEIEKYKCDIDQLQKTCEKNKFDVVEQLEKAHEKEIAYLMNNQKRINSLLEKVVSKPMITNNTSIKGNNNSSVNHLQTVLASHDLYNKQTDPERIKTIDPLVIEKHFWAGQKGIARLSVRDIINVVEDGDEKLITPTLQAC